MKEFTDEHLLIAARWVLLGVFALIPVAGAYMFWDLVPVVLLAVFITIMLTVFQSYLIKKFAISMKRASQIIILCIILGVALPTGICVWMGVTSGTTAVELIQDTESKTKAHTFLISTETKLLEKYPGIGKWVEKGKEILQNTQAVYLGGAGLSKLLKSIGGKTIVIGKVVLASLGSFFLSFLLLIFLIYHFLNNWPVYIDGIMLILPFNKEKKEAILTGAKEVIRNVAIGMSLNGVYQGGAGIIVLYVYFLFFNPVGWIYYVITGVLLFILSVFTAPISALAVVIASITEMASGSLVCGIVLLATVPIISAADNISKVYLSDKLRLGFVLTILAMLYGMKAFSGVGFLLGILIVMFNKDLLRRIYEYLKKKEEIEQVSKLAIKEVNDSKLIKQEA